MVTGGVQRRACTVGDLVAELGGCPRQRSRPFRLALRAALEVDSREYHFSEAEWKATLDRHNRLTRFGLAVTHYPPSVVSARARGWLAEVEGWLGARAVELGMPVVTRAKIVAPPPGAQPAPLVVRRRPPRA